MLMAEVYNKVFLQKGLMMKQLMLLLIVLTLFSCQRHIYVSVSEGVSVPERFVSAYNQKNISGMVALVAGDVRYMFVSGDQVYTEVAGKEKLDTFLQGFFANSTPSTSEVLMHTHSGDFHQMIEKASYLDKAGNQKSQCSAVVYQVTGELILNIWYFDAHACP